MSALDTLKSQARAWAAKVVQLHNTPVPAGALAVEKARLLSEAGNIKNGIEKILGKIDEFATVDEIQNLGILPVVIPAVTVTMFIGDIAKWFYGYNAFQKNLDGYKVLRDGGLNHDQTMEVLRESKNAITPQSTASGFFDGFTRSLTLPLIGAVGVLAFLVLKK